MKLDYLQFLELEIFTRFGARLEATMEAAIQKGRVLRELLKQDRLSPLSPTLQMAWLVAFNNDLFQNADSDTTPALLARLKKAAGHTTLSLDSPREEWSAAVASWLSDPAQDSSS